MEEIIKGEIVSINTSEKKGGKKSPTSSAVINNTGIKGDGHSGDWHRQISLLSAESIQKVKEAGIEVNPGDFAENLTISGLDFLKLDIGDRLEISDALGKKEVVLEVTQVGKECPKPCSIYYQMGSCIMPKEGIFTRVIKPGNVKVGDKIIIGV